MKMPGSNSPPPNAWFARWGTRLRHSQRLASRYPPNAARPRPRGRRRSWAEMSVTVKPFSERRGAHDVANVAEITHRIERADADLVAFLTLRRRDAVRECRHQESV